MVRDVMGRALPSARCNGTIRGRPHSGILSLFAARLHFLRHKHGVQMHLIGKTAPHFELEAVDDGQFKLIALDDLRGRWVVLLFYPLDFTFVCPTELWAFSDRLEEFHALG